MVDLLGDARGFSQKPEALAGAADVHEGRALDGEGHGERELAVGRAGFSGNLGGEARGFGEASLILGDERQVQPGEGGLAGVAELLEERGGPGERAPRGGQLAEGQLQIAEAGGGGAFEVGIVELAGDRLRLFQAVQALVDALLATLEHLADLGEHLGALGGAGMPAHQREGLAAVPVGLVGVAREKRQPRERAVRAGELEGRLVARGGRGALEGVTGVVVAARQLVDLAQAVERAREQVRSAEGGREGDGFFGQGAGQLGLVHAAVGRGEQVEELQAGLGVRAGAQIQRRAGEAAALGERLDHEALAGGGQQPGQGVRGALAGHRVVREGADQGQGRAIAERPREAIGEGLMQPRQGRRLVAIADPRAKRGVVERQAEGLLFQPLARGQGGQRGLGGVGADARRVGGQGHAERAGGNGEHRQQGALGGVELSPVGRVERLDAVGQGARRARDQLPAGLAARQLAVGEHVAKQVLDEARVAAGGAQHLLDGGGGRLGGAQVGRHQLGDLARHQGGDRQLVAGELGGELGGGGDPGDRPAGALAHEVGQERLARGVGAVPVVKGHDEPARFGQRAEQADEGGLEGLGGVGARRALAGEGREGELQRVGGLGAAALADGQQVAAQIDPGAVGHGVARAVRGDHGEVHQAGLGRELLEQARLADARGAEEQKRPGGVALGGLVGVAEQVAQEGFSADEGR
ncbi:hypothetical protein D3C72_446300 [compost metagenome]